MRWDIHCQSIGKGCNADDPALNKQIVKNELEVCFRLESSEHRKYDSWDKLATNKWIIFLQTDTF
jgi:hypothetical protein